MNGDPALILSAGDIRANDSPFLMMMTIILVLEHNYWASIIENVYPFLSSDMIFEEAKRRVVAEI